MTPSREYECCILGAGPAGLGAAIELTRHGTTNTLVIDRNPIVGGLARTETLGGARFDVGPHRFFTQNRFINRLWHQLLKEDFKPVERLTRIYYKGKYFQYPLKAGNALLNLGPKESTQALFSFLLTKLQRQPSPETFEQWVTQKFGRKLYETFFKSYTEKVWGIPCSQIGAEWAAQRIRGLDVVQILKHSLLASTRKAKRIKTLVEQFDYPVRGAGQMYEVMQERVAAQGVEFRLGHRITAFDHKENRITAIEMTDAQGKQSRISARHIFNSIPITHFFKMLNPGPEVGVQQAAEALYYREHVTVDLLIDSKDCFPDQWIYIHSPEVKMARLANYRNFSRAMTGGKGKTPLSVEYFTFQNEPLWKLPDKELIALATDELSRMKLIHPETVDQAWVVRETESYPTYYLGFQEPYHRLKTALGAFTNLSPIGRGGLYKYNNQDHSTLSGILAAKNYLGLPGSPFNLWDLNVEETYLEAGERKNRSTR